MRQTKPEAPPLANYRPRRPPPRRQPQRREGYGMVIFFLSGAVVLAGSSIWKLTQQQQQQPPWANRKSAAPDVADPIDGPAVEPPPIAETPPPAAVQFTPARPTIQAPEPPPRPKRKPQPVVQVLEGLRAKERIVEATSQAVEALKVLVPQVTGGFGGPRPVRFEIVKLSPILQIEHKPRSYQTAEGNRYVSQSDAKIVVKYRRTVARGIPPIRTACLYLEDGLFVGAVLLSNPAALSRLEDEMANYWAEPIYE